MIKSKVIGIAKVADAVRFQFLKDEHQSCNDDKRMLVEQSSSEWNDLTRQEKPLLTFALLLFFI